MTRMSIRSLRTIRAHAPHLLTREDKRRLFVAALMFWRKA